MDDNNLVKEMYPEQVKSINPYDISYIAMKNGSIIMIIEKTTPNNYKNINYNKNEQSSPNFNLGRNKHISYITKEKKENKENKENNNFNYSFCSYDNNDKNPCLIEKRKYIFYKKSNNKDKEDKKNINTFNHSKTFSYSNTTPVKRKNNLENSENSTFKINKNNDGYYYDNISITASKYSSKKNKNKTYNSNFSYGFIKSKSENIILNNNTNGIIYNDDNYEIHKKPKIEYYNDNDENRFSLEQYYNHTVLNNSVIKNNRPKTPIYSMRDLGKKNHRKNNENKKNNLELKKCLSKDNHRYYERKELSAPKKKKSNYIKMKMNDGNTIHVFENK